MTSGWYVRCPIEFYQIPNDMMVGVRQAHRTTEELDAAYMENVCGPGGSRCGNVGSWIDD
jgi:hypothetical protein